MKYSGTNQAKRSEHDVKCSQSLYCLIAAMCMMGAWVTQHFQHMNEQPETGVARLYVTPTRVCETLIELAEYEMPPQFPR